jgi:hypothetical protein
MGWKDNALMFWSSDNGSTWNKISDHNRDPLAVSYERIERKNRMADGTLRRYTVAKKRSFSTSWTMLPSRRNATYNGKIGMSTVDDGWSGEEMEAFHTSVDGRFLMKIRKGNDEAKAITDGTIEVVAVMITDFSKDIEKRGTVDLWTINLTLEEV